MGEARTQDFIILGFYLLSEPVLEKEQEFSLLERSNTSATTLNRRNIGKNNYLTHIFIVESDFESDSEDDMRYNFTLSCVIKTLNSVRSQKRVKICLTIKIAQ